GAGERATDLQHLLGDEARAERVGGVGARAEERGGGRRKRRERLGARRRAVRGDDERREEAVGWDETLDEPAEVLEGARLDRLERVPRRRGGRAVGDEERRVSVLQLRRNSHPHYARRLSAAAIGEAERRDDVLARRHAPREERGREELQPLLPFCAHE